MNPVTAVSPFLSYSTAELVAGGLFSQLLVVPLLVAPLERIKVLMQTDKRHRGQVDCLRYVLRHSGERTSPHSSIL